MTEEVAKKKRVFKETVSRERIRQIQTRAIGKLRRLMFERGYKFEDFFDEIFENNQYLLSCPTTLFHISREMEYTDLVWKSVVRHSFLYQILLISVLEICSYGKEFLFKIKRSFMEEFWIQIIPMFECLVWGFHSVFRHERCMFAFEDIDEHKAQQVTIHIFLVCIRMDLESSSFHRSIESFYKPVCLRSIWFSTSMTNSIRLTNEVKYSCQITLFVSLMIIEGILLSIICEYSVNMEWKESNSRFKDCCCSTCFFVRMKFEIHESSGSIYCNMDIVFHSINLGSVGDINMKKSRFILFELSSDSFFVCLSLSNQSP